MAINLVFPQDGFVLTIAYKLRLILRVDTVLEGSSTEPRGNPISMIIVTPIHQESLILFVYNVGNIQRPMKYTRVMPLAQCIPKSHSHVCVIWPMYTLVLNWTGGAAGLFLMVVTRVVQPISGDFREPNILNVQGSPLENIMRRVWYYLPPILLILVIFSR